MNGHCGYLVNVQTHLLLFDKCCKATVEIKRVQLGKQTNTEHGEVNLPMKAHAFVHRLIEEFWCGPFKSRTGHFFTRVCNFLQLHNSPTESIYGFSRSSTSD